MNLTQYPAWVRLLVAQVAAFGMLLLLAFYLPQAWRPPLWGWPLVQGGLSATFGYRWGLRKGWLVLQFLVPWLLLWQMGAHPSAWVYPTLLSLLLLVFGGGLTTRVPLYHSNRAAWQALLELAPGEPGASVIDLGAGFGGPLAHLARHRTDLRIVGVEASPLVWLVARLRTWPLRERCKIRLGSLWGVDLKDHDLVYAFLSPAPMPELWGKALAEMRPGTRLVSNTFPVPEATPEALIPLPGRRDACLWVYRIPGAQESRTH